MTKSRIILIIVLVVLALGYIIWSGVSQPEPSPLVTPPIPTATSPAGDLLAYLETSWPRVEVSLAMRPTYHDPAKPRVWGLPTVVQFIGNGVLLARIEDDNDVHVVVLRLNGDHFTVAEIIQSKGSFTTADWQTLVTKYGADTYPITTYTLDLVREGQIVSFPRLTLVPENVFDLNYFNSK